MKVSFKGIENLKILKRTTEETGVHFDPNGTARPVDINKTCIKVYCDFNDDSSGKDLSKYKAVLNNLKANCGVDYSKNTATKDRSCEVDVELKEVKISKQKFNFVNFKLNGNDITLKDDSLLPAYSFLAQMTTKMGCLPLLSESQQYYIDLVKSKIEEEACDYLNIEKNW